MHPDELLYPALFHEGHAYFLERSDSRTASYFGGPFEGSTAISVMMLVICVLALALARHKTILLSNNAAVVHLQCPTCTHVWSLDTGAGRRRHRRAAA